MLQIVFKIFLIRNENVNRVIDKHFLVQRSITTSMTKLDIIFILV